MALYEMFRIQDQCISRVPRLSHMLWAMEILKGVNLSMSTADNQTNTIEDMMNMMMIGKDDHLWIKIGLNLSFVFSVHHTFQLLFPGNQGLLRYSAECSLRLG